MIVSVPASSANLGPGFDALGLALSMRAEVGWLDGAGATAPPEGALLAENGHPGSVAFRRAGGRGALWLRCPIPSGRGLGFSGAVRVAGLLAAAAQQGEPVDRGAILAMATELEGHADNVAASLFGGLVAVAGGAAVVVPLGLEPAVVVWVPATSTATDASRRRLADPVPRADAVFNVGHTGLLVAAMAAGRIDVLREATEDRLHQDVRFAAAPASRAALAAGLAHGAWCAWLSGSGPTVAMFCDPADAARVASGLPAGGRAVVLAIDHAGAVLAG